MKEKAFTPDLIDVWASRHGFVFEADDKTEISDEEVQRISDEVKARGYTNSDLEYYSILPNTTAIVFVYPAEAAFASGDFFRDMNSIPFRQSAFDILSNFTRILKRNQNK